MAFPFNTEKLTEGHSLDQLRSIVKNTIIERQTTHREDLFEITYYHIQPQYFSNLSKIDASIRYDGYWLKFEEDYTFNYGIYGKKIGSGIYHYQASGQLLIMLDDDENIEPKLFTVLGNSEFMNFMGRPLIAYDGPGNKPTILLSNWSQDNYINSLRKYAEAYNGMQIKMILLEDQPIK